MTRSRATGLKTAKASLGKAMEEGDPKKIAAAAVRVMAADPMSANVFLYGFALFPLISRLLKDKSYEPYSDHIIEPVIIAEMEKIEKKVGKHLPTRYKDIVIKSFMHALRKQWRENKALYESKKKG